MERLGGRTIRGLVIFAASAGAVAALYFGRELLVPFVLATLVTLLLDPAVRRLQHWGLGRVPAVIGIVGLTAVVLAGVVWILAGQLARLGENFPGYRETFRVKLRSLKAPLEEAFGRGREATEEIQKELSSLGKPSAPDAGAVKVQVVESVPPALKPLADVAGSVLDILGIGAIVLLLVSFLLLYYVDVRDRLLRLVGLEQVHLTTQAMEEAATNISHYLVMHSVLNAMHGTLLGCGLLAIGVPNALFWGILAALLRFIPYLGPWISAALPSMLALVVFEGWTRPGLVVLFLVSLELVSNMVLEPWLYGRRTGLSPLAVVVSAIFWAWLWGGVGLVMAVPLTVCLLVLGHHVPGLEFLAVLLGSDPPLQPQVRLYHRLLAGDTDEALDVAKDWRERNPGEDVRDGLLLPALALAEADHRRGNLDDSKTEEIRSSLDELIEEIEVPPTTGRMSPPAGMRLLCLPAGDAFDGVSSEIVSRELRGRGVLSETGSSRASAGEKVALVEKSGADVLLISSLPPRTAAGARYLYKRLRRRFPDMTIILGLWTSRNDLARIQARYAPDGKTHLVGTFADAWNRIRELSQASRCSSPASVSAS